MSKHIIYKNHLIKHGAEISGEINGQSVSGHLSINDDDADKNGYALRAYFCQEQEHGSTPIEKFGHLCGWVFRISKKKEENDYLIWGVEITSYRNPEQLYYTNTDTNTKLSSLTNLSAQATSLKEKLMNTITNVFKSKENKALEHFGLGTTCELNDKGKAQFLDFIFETGKTDKNEFFATIVTAYEEDASKK